MLPADWTRVDKRAIEALIDDGTPEGVGLEYKELLATANDSQKKEFLADVSSFANAGGGDLVFGIAEGRDANGQPTNVPASAPGLANFSEADLTRLESIILTGIAPRFSVQMKIVPGFARGPVLVLRVPRSWSGPHMVTYQNTSRFFSRSGAGKLQLDIHQLRAAFAQSEALPERIRALRLERLGRIVADEAPGPVAGRSALILHIVPYSAFGPPLRLDLQSIRTSVKLFPPNPYGGWDTRFTLDGLVAKGATPGFTQLFRTGVIEMVETPVSSTRENISQLWLEQIEKTVVDHLPKFNDLLLSLGVAPPFAVLLTIANVRDHHAVLSPRRHMSHYRDHTVDRDQLLLPEVVIETGRESLVSVLRPLFDALWQSCNFERSFSYDDAGNWRTLV